MRRRLLQIVRGAQSKIGFVGSVRLAPDGTRCIRQPFALGLKIGMDSSLLRHLLAHAVEAVAGQKSASVNSDRPFTDTQANLFDLVEHLRTETQGGAVAITMVRARIWH